MSLKLAEALAAEKEAVGLLEMMLSRAGRAELEGGLKFAVVQTYHQIRNLQKAFGQLREEPATNESRVTVDIMQKFRERTRDRSSSQVGDSAIRMALTELVHLHLALYETLIPTARARDLPDVVGLLEENLRCEELAAADLGGLNERIQEAA